MENNKDKLENYVRIGTDFYRKVQLPLINDTAEVLQKWRKETIKDDFETKEFKPIYHIQKYTGFCFVPGHGDDYQQGINGFYNQYEKLKWQAVKGDCQQTLDFLVHIFGDQFEYGLDYLALLYLNPSQILPILCLVSVERATGKSTFVKWLKRIFESNMTINSNEEFRARFNSDWITKLIIAVEETLLDKKEDSERIKALSTGDVAKVERKNIDKAETPFYGKFVLCSNNENNFIKIDQSEIRYWVRKINLPKTDNTDLLDELASEIPAFLFYLTERGIKSQKKSRMWFHQDELSTAALEKLRKGNKSGLEKEIETIILEKMDDFEENEIKLTFGDLQNELKRLNVTQSYLKTVLQDGFKLTPRENPSTYRFYHWSDSPTSDGSNIKNYTTKSGRYYTFVRSMFETNKLDNSVKTKEVKMEVVKRKIS